MTQFGRLLPGKVPLYGSILLLLQSLLFLQFPLLNVLGLEFSAATSILASLVAGLIPARIVHDSPEVGAWEAFARTFPSIVLFAVVPLLLAVFNAMWVTNCAMAEGLLYYLAIVPLATAFTVSLAILSARVSSRYPRMLFAFLWIAVILHVPAVTFFSEQIFAYNPVVGFFPGFSYDDTLDALPDLLLYRITTILAIIAFLSTSQLVTEWRRKSMLSYLPRNLAVIAWVSCAIVWVRSDTLGFSSSLTRIEEELGGSRETEHFRLVYPKDVVDDVEADRLAMLHEFHFTRLARTLRVSPDRKIVSILYSGPAQKSRLCGGGSTDFAKPWLWQLHILLADVDRVLKHELVHVLAAEFGFPLIRVGLNSGLVEGLAVAMERESYGMSLHRAAAAVLSTGVSVDLESLFSVSGFFSAHSSVAYTLAGSFCRHLIERYPVRTFKHAYGSGSFSWYGKEFGVLVNEWLRRIGEVDLTESDSAKASYLFRRPPQFAEECYHFKGNLLRRSRLALASGEDSVALSLVQESLDHSFSFNAVYLKSVILVRLGRFRDALESIHSYADRDSLIRDIPLRLVEGDALWGSGYSDRAREAYAEVALTDLSDGWTETALLRMALAEEFPADTSIVRLVTGSMPDSVRVGGWRDLISSHDHPYLKFAAARVMDTRRDADTIMYLLRDFDSPAYPFLSYAARIRTARACLAVNNHERAKGYYWEAQNFTADEVRLRRIEESIDWAGWLESSDRSN